MIGRGERPESEAAPSQNRVGAAKKHQLTLKGREDLLVDGVTNVDSFDDQAVIVETSQGLMIIKGEQLHIKALNLEAGQLNVEGFVHSLEYAGDGAGKRAKGLMGRLFK